MIRVLLLGGAGTLLGAVVAAALTRGGARVVRGHAADDPPLRSRHYGAYREHPPLGAAGAFGPFILEHAQANPTTVLLPLDDTALLALQATRPALDAMAPVAAAPFEATAIALDKARTVAAAAAVAGGLEAPPAILPVDLEAALQWPGPYPVLVKPRTGSGGEGIRIARDRNELQAAYALTAALHERPLVQLWVPHRVTRRFHLNYVFDHDGRLASWYGHRVLAESRSIRVGGGDGRHAGGLALVWESRRDVALLERGRLLLESIGWRGIGIVEGAFDERDGRPWLFEINARLGSTQVLSLKRDVNVALDACRVALGLPPTQRRDFAEGIRARLDPLTLAGSRDPALLARLLDPRCVGLQPGPEDPWPLLHYLARGVAGWTRRRW